jgi:TATA-box binding protein (TBP) (component of TFIID and TFIIIB)
MELAEYTGKPCRTKMAYEFLPKNKIDIDLDKAAEELNSIANIDVKTKVLLMMKLDNLTISLFPSGKLLVRGEREEEKAKKAAEKILKQLKESIK